MSQITWTPDALSSEQKPLQGRAWRAVEAQHQKSTMKLVDSLGEQAVLEQEIEAAKPPVPADAAGFDYLLYTPFRYSGAYPRGSRFRRAGMTEGVFYGCESPFTAMAEMAFLRLLFFAESPGTPFPSNPAEYTVFSVQIRSQRCLDTTRGGLLRDAALWMQPADYSFCQALAEQARRCATEVIRYRSVRDPAGGFNVAVLSLAAFASKKISDMQSWHLQLQNNVAWAKCEAPAQTISFDASLFLNDERLASLRTRLSA